MFQRAIFVLCGLDAIKPLGHDLVVSAAMPSHSEFASTVTRQTGTFVAEVVKANNMYLAEATYFTLYVQRNTANKFISDNAVSS